MQIAPVSGFQYGNYTAPMSASAAGGQTAPSGPDRTEAPAAPANTPDPVEALAEPTARPAFSVLASDSGTRTATLMESTGSGGIPAKMAAAIYSLNLSFDIQAQALDLLA